MKKKILPYLLLAPMILIMGVLVFYPIITTFAYSLKRWKLTEPGNIHYIGFKNYIDILQSDSFKYSMQNTPFRRARAFPEAKTVVTQPLLCPCR